MDFCNFLVSAMTTVLQVIVKDREKKKNLKIILDMVQVQIITFVLSATSSKHKDCGLSKASFLL